MCLCYKFAKMFFQRCFMTHEDRQRLSVSNRIDKELEREQRQSLRVFKLLLLGTGESGKSTFIKQMRIIHGDGYTEEDRKGFIKYVHLNVIQSMQAILAAMPVLGIPLQRGTKLAEELEAVNTRTSVLLSKRQFHVIQCLWQDKGVQEVFARRNEYQLSDCTSYFMTRIDDILDPEYVPTVQDVLHVRVPTTGIVEHKFKINKVFFQMIDVSGQRSERRKWLHCFDNVTSVVFLVALSEYDQTLYECNSVNRLDESLALYQRIIKCSWLSQATFVLFLNKTDLLEEKIQYSHLEDYFPEYRGPRRCAASAKKHIMSMFSDVNESLMMPTYFHFTCATDTQNIEVVFAVVKETILRKIFEEFRLN